MSKGELIASMRLGEIIDNPAALVRQYKRQVPFRVEEIGGPAALVLWRAEQAKKLAAYEATRHELKNKQVQRIAGDAPLGELTWEGKVLLSDSKAWDAKLKEAKQRRKEYHQPQILSNLVIEKEEKTEEIIEKPSILKRFTNYLSKFLH